MLRLIALKLKAVSVIKLLQMPNKISPMLMTCGYFMIVSWPNNSGLSHAPPNR